MISKFSSTSGWMIPRIPTTYPFRTIFACLPWKNAGSSQGSIQYAHSPLPFPNEIPFINFIINRSSTPWMSSNAEVLHACMTQALRLFLAPAGRVGSTNTTSETSKIRIGRWCYPTLDCTHFKSPGINEVLAIW